MPPERTTEPLVINYETPQIDYFSGAQQPLDNPGPEPGGSLYK